MTRLFVIATALMFTAGCNAYAQCSAHPFYATQKEDGTRIGLVATDADLARDTAWTPGHGEPPISAGQAYDLARAWARVNWKRYDSFGLESISLQTLGCDSSNKKWVYVVSLAPIIDGNRLFGSTYVVGVLMDGSIIAPRNVKNDF
jgi:hypothetical protein